MPKLTLIDFLTSKMDIAMFGYKDWDVKHVDFVDGVFMISIDKIERNLVV